MNADEREAEADSGGEKFPEIEHTGGRITFHVDERGISTEFKHSNNCAASLHQVCVSFEGEILDFVSFGGLGAVVPYPQPSILVLLASDREVLTPTEN